MTSPLATTFEQFQPFWNLAMRHEAQGDVFVAASKAGLEPCFSSAWREGSFRRTRQKQRAGVVT